MDRPPIRTQNPRRHSAQATTAAIRTRVHRFRRQGLTLPQPRRTRTKSRLRRLLQAGLLRLLPLPKRTPRQKAQARRRPSPRPLLQYRRQRGLTQNRPHQLSRPEERPQDPLRPRLPPTRRRLHRRNRGIPRQRQTLSGNPAQPGIHPDLQKRSPHPQRRGKYPPSVPQ